MNKTKLKEELTAESMKDAYDSYVKKTGLKIDYDEFCSSVKNSANSNGLLSDDDLDNISGGLIGFSPFLRRKKV